MGCFGLKQEKKTFNKAVHACAKVAKFGLMDLQILPVKKKSPKMGGGYCRNTKKCTFALNF